MRTPDDIVFKITRSDLEEGLRAFAPTQGFHDTKRMEVLLERISNAINSVEYVQNGEVLATLISLILATAREGKGNKLLSDRSIIKVTLVNLMLILGSYHITEAMKTIEETLPRAQ